MAGKLLVLVNESFDPEQALEGIPMEYVAIIGPVHHSKVHYSEISEIEDTAFTFCLLNSVSEIIALNETLVLLAAFLNSHFKTKGLTLENANCFRNKSQMKKLVAKAGLRTPNYVKIQSKLEGKIFAAEIGYPVVVKPLQEAGASGVIKVVDEKDWRKVSFDKFWASKFLVEKFIVGDMYEIDGFTDDMQLVLYVPSLYVNSPLYLLEGSHAGNGLMPPTHPLYQRLRSFTQDVLGVLPKVCSFFHLEVFHEKSTDSILFCEIACRPPAMVVPEIWQKGFGCNLHNVALKLKLNMHAPIIENPVPKCYWYCIVFPVIPGKVLYAVPNQKDYPNCEFTQLIPLNSPPQLALSVKGICFKAFIAIGADMEHTKVQYLAQQIGENILWK